MVRDLKTLRDCCSAHADTLRACAALQTSALAGLHRNRTPVLRKEHHGLLAAATLLFSVPVHCRAVVCWVRAAVQQCRVEAPRKCMVYLSSDSSQVRRGSLLACMVCTVCSLGLSTRTSLLVPQTHEKQAVESNEAQAANGRAPTSCTDPELNGDPDAPLQAIDMFRERLAHYGMTTIVAPGQVQFIYPIWFRDPSKQRTPSHAP